uniref:Peptidase S33 tripeptidyl aminopeptidase-like C-terminal domain-containing protein n=1 Tax=Peronospora matthiolae TaxID=2874970 RepID=A0AAV1VPI7_9STRA
MCKANYGVLYNEVERMMVLLHESLEGTVNVYTMDLRGVGRSTLLDCVATKAMTSGSLYGRLIHPLEVSSCARELHRKYGDLASFSTTSAAIDVSTFISEYANGMRTTVYGVSYGTLVVQRLMHFNPSNVTGYVLDGIVTTTGAPGDRAYLTSWDADFDDVCRRFMKRCAQDSECDSHFKTTDLSATLHNVLSMFDTNPNSTCATLIRNSTGCEPSEGLRRELGMLLEKSATRSLIPPLVYRLSRCGWNDLKVLTRYFEAISTIPPSIYKDTSELIYNMVTFSELWEIRTPSYAELEKRFTDASISSGALYEFLSLYCAFSKEESPACDGFELDNYEANGIMYLRDQYYAMTPPVPDHASVLLMNDNLDPVTHPRYAMSLYKALNTTRKELVLFDYASHGVVNSTVFGDGVRTCGMELLVSYVAGNGALERLDKTCIAKMPAFDMTMSPEDLRFYFGTDDAYDSVLIPSGLNGIVGSG